MEEAGEELRFLRRLLKARPAVLHVHWLWWVAGGRGRLAALLRAAAFLGQLVAARCLGVRVVWTVHNLTTHECPHPAIESLTRRALARLSATLIVHCEAAAGAVRERWRLPAGTGICVIPHGTYAGSYPPPEARASARAELGAGADDLVVLFLGKIRGYKGVPELIEAFATLEEPPGRHLVIAGEPLGRGVAGEIEALVRGVPGVRLLLRFVDAGEVAGLMAAADVVAAPYRRVLTSGSVVLAMSMGKPVVAPRVGCIPETVGEGTAFLYDPTDSSGLRSALQLAVRERAGLAEMGRRALARSRSFDWREVAEATRRVYLGDR